jgi:hypothetical protein
LTVVPPTLGGVAVAPPSIKGGLTALGAVALTGEAPTGGVTVTLSSDSAAATVPASMAVDAGKFSAGFKVVTSSVSSDTTVHITATVGTASSSVALKVLAPQPLSLALTPTEVYGGAKVLGLVQIDAKAPSGGTTVTLSSDSSFATPPATVKIDAGKTTAAFVITTSPVSTDSTATISATTNGVTKTKQLEVDAPKLIKLGVPPSVDGGKSALGAVYLTGEAPTGGVTVTLTSSSSDVVVPGSVEIPSGKVIVTFSITTSAVTTDTNVTITATYGTTTKKATITVKK